MKPILIEAPILHDYNEMCSREWLETNGLGGYASCSLSGVLTRKYHGLLVVALSPPVQRVVLVSKLDENITHKGKTFHFSTNQFPNTVSPAGFLYLTSFKQELFPVFEYNFEGVKIRKTIICLHDEETTLVKYELLEGAERVPFFLKPITAFRDIHDNAHKNPNYKIECGFGQDILNFKPYEHLPEAFIQVPDSSFYFKPNWMQSFEHLEESLRGQDYLEDLFNYGQFNTVLELGIPKVVVLSTKKPEIGMGLDEIKAEKHRREQLFKTLLYRDKITERLSLAADQFVVKRGKKYKSVIAGYHWFSDWGRDTMISLPGLCISTGRLDDAKQILHVFSEATFQGLLPNRFSDDGEGAEYNTVDASLWFFIAAFQYAEASQDYIFIESVLYPVLEDIIHWHIKGTLHGIKLDDDGLLYAGEPGVQLTWMDAKCGDWVVTPREGKAVEINALWYNALCIMQKFSAIFKKNDREKFYSTQAEHTKKSFVSEFYYEEGKYLYDYIYFDYKDICIRPNQIFAITLPFPLIEGEMAHQVLDCIENHLLTNVGLRSLSPYHTEFKPRYQGGVLERDGAYHQGTVWSWLLGPYIIAENIVRGKNATYTPVKIEKLLDNLLSEAGIGTISEIYDATDPHYPKGCIAQAWGVAEILRAYIEIAKEKS